jgi:hypothetical protein
MFIIDTLSINSVMTILLIVIGLVLFTVKFQYTDDFVFSNYDFGWIMAITPIFCGQLLFLQHLTKMYSLFRNNKVIFKSHQVTCFSLFYVSLIMMMIGEINIILFPGFSLITNYLFLISIPTFVCSTLIIINNETLDLAVTRGEAVASTPVRDEHGNWVIYQNQITSLLLGTIKLKTNSEVAMI